ncbi:hypothetical protein [Synechococcus sp. CCY 0621]|uniref:hypothetical protein n=1 Tax=Synechococcus sp. CCY 0621 TaxID=2815603 RepID=UPI001C211D16
MPSNRADFQVEAAALRLGLLGQGCRELPVRAEQALAVQHLPWIHRDPFDRLLLVQARLEGLRLLSAPRRSWRHSLNKETACSSEPALPLGSLPIVDMADPYRIAQAKFFASAARRAVVQPRRQALAFRKSWASTSSIRNPGARRGSKPSSTQVSHTASGADVIPQGAHRLHAAGGLMGQGVPQILELGQEIAYGRP